MLLSFRYSSGQRKKDFDLGGKNMRQKLPDRPQTLIPSSQVFYPGCDSPGNCAEAQAWGAHRAPLPDPQEGVTSALEHNVIVIHWGGVLMALIANLRIFACDLISHGAPRGWVTSAPGAERVFFFPFRSSSLWNHVILQDFSASVWKQGFHPGYCRKVILPGLGSSRRELKMPSV